MWSEARGRRNCMMRAFTIGMMGSSFPARINVY